MRRDPRSKPKRLLLVALSILGLAATSRMTLGSASQLSVELESLGLGSWIGAPPPASPRFLVPAEPAGPAIGPAFDPRSYVRRLPYGPMIERTARRHGLDALLLASVIEVESSFRPDAVSEKGAVGLMQVMPFNSDDGVVPIDPSRNLELGAAYLASLTRHYDGDLPLALAAYQAGPGAVDRYGGIPPFASTRHYVEKVLSLYSEHLEQLLEDGSEVQAAVTESAAGTSS